MIAARSRALAAISHDLRTIITRMRLRAEFIDDEPLRAKMLHDVDLMDSMLYKNLLFLRDERYRHTQEIVDLDSVLQTVADQFADLGHDVAYEGDGRRMVIGSLTDLQRVFANLVENAVAHGRRVVISVERARSTTASRSTSPTMVRAFPMRTRRRSSSLSCAAGRGATSTSMAASASASRSCAPSSRRRAARCGCSTASRMGSSPG